MRHRDRLPQLGGELFVTDGGLETTLIYQDGLTFLSLLLSTCSEANGVPWR
jgi:hypothetical protein